MTSKFERFLPCAGVLSAALFVLFGLVGGSPPSVKSDAAKQVAWMNAHETRVYLAAFAGALFLVTMAFFAAGVRKAIRSGEPGESTYSSVAYAGVLLTGLAVAGAAWMSLAGAEAAHDHQSAVVHTIFYVNDVNWIIWTASSAVMMLGVGLGGLRTAALPKWLSIVTIVLGVLNLAGPGGIAVFFVTPLWLILTGVALLRRLSSAPSTAAVPTYAGASA